MILNKLFWTLRAIIYSPFLGKIILPSYIGKPLAILGYKKIFIGKKGRNNIFFNYQQISNGNTRY